MGDAEESVHIRADMAEEQVTEALGEVTRALNRAEGAFDRTGREATEAGTRIDRGMGKAARATNRARDAAGRFVVAGHAAGEAAETAGGKAARGSLGFDKWAASANKASRAAGGLGATMMLLKFGTLLTAGVAVVGMLAALASGAVMAVGALSPMVGTVGALIPMFGLLAATMGLMKISGEDLKALLRPLGNEFKAMRYEITQALVPGIQKFNRLLAAGLVPTLRGGLTGLGGSFGSLAEQIATMLTQARNVRMLGVFFRGLDPVVAPLGRSLGHILRILITLAVAAQPMLTRMAEGFERVTARLDAWTAGMTDSGRAQAWFLRAWETMISTGEVLRDWLVGLYHIFRLAGQVAREEFGGGLLESAAAFRTWTETAGGQERILGFFRDSVPALRETLALIKSITMWFIGLAENSRIAPLINQIRTELAPAFKLFMDSLMGQGGFGSAIIDMFTALFTVLGTVPLDGLTLLVQALGGLIWGIAWLVANVPGAGIVLGTLLTAFFMIGIAGKAVGVGFKMFGWIDDVVRGTGKLSGAQKALSWVLGGVAPVLRGIGTALLFVGRGMWALVTNPLGLVILAIIGIRLLLWWKWDEIKEYIYWGIDMLVAGFVWLGRAIAQPFIDLWNIVKAVYNFIAERWNSIPAFTIPAWVPFVGGKTFELPKLPMLAKGGIIEYGTALVGEQGPEALVKGGRFLGMVGLSGPELHTGLPRGGYVVPSVSTLTQNPGLLHQLPGSVADAVAGAMPGYGALLHRGTPYVGAPDVRVDVDTGSGAVVEAIEGLTAALLARRDPPPDDATAAILKALRGRGPRPGVAERYRYVPGGR